MESQKLQILTLCSIPEEQKPIQEYLTWKNFFFNTFFSIFFSFWNGKKAKLVLSLFFYVFLFYVDFEIHLYSFIWITLLLFAVFFGVFELSKKLQIGRLLYEESSWFDSQLWEKPFFLIRQDKLLATQCLFSVQKKIFRLLCFFLFSCFVNLN